MWTYFSNIILLKVDVGPVRKTIVHDPRHEGVRALESQANRWLWVKSIIKISFAVDHTIFLFADLLSFLANQIIF